jgi:hypothetical protein
MKEWLSKLSTAEYYYHEWRVEFPNCTQFHAIVFSIMCDVTAAAALLMRARSSTKLMNFGRECLVFTLLQNKSNYVISEERRNQEIGPYRQMHTSVKVSFNPAPQKVLGLQSYHLVA